MWTAFDSPTMNSLQINSWQREGMFAALAMQHWWFYSAADAKIALL